MPENEDEVYKDLKNKRKYYHGRVTTLCQKVEQILIV